jgi:hypothetical protein
MLVSDIGIKFLFMAAVRQFLFLVSEDDMNARRSVPRGSNDYQCYSPCLIQEKNDRDENEIVIIRLKMEKRDLDRASDFIARIQAKRLLFGLENFKIIVIDFQDVEWVGRPFADEIFRVFHNDNPEIKIIARNAGDEIAAMLLYMTADHSGGEFTLQLS